MNIRIVSYLSILMVLLLVGRSDGQQQSTSTKDAPFVVQLTWDDADNTPATGVYIEAQGYPYTNVSTRSFVLKMVKDGRYEARLPPGVYDVFVSEAGSNPQMQTRAGHRQHPDLEAHVGARLRIHAALGQSGRVVAGCPSIRTKVVSSTKVSCRCFGTVFFAAREVEDQDSGNLTLNHLRWRSFHQPSIRPKPRP